MNKQRILIAGGDLRQIYCAEELAGKYSTSVIGFDDRFLPVGCRSQKASADEKNIYDVLVLPVPPIDTDGYINTKCTQSRIAPRELLPMLKENARIFTGRQDSRLKEIFPHMSITDYMDREELALKNAVPTAEGAVRLALENLPVTLNGLSVLIVGLGRIGTALSLILKGFGADVTAAVHNSRGTAKGVLLGAKTICTRNITGDFGLVFNTVPSLVFDDALLRKFNGSTLFIDLASRPGGFDMNAASMQGKKVLWELGIPGKSAPVTAGKYVAETISDILDGGDEHD